MTWMSKALSTTGERKHEINRVLEIKLLSWYVKPRGCRSSIIQSDKEKWLLHWLQENLSQKAYKNAKMECLILL